MNVYCVYVLGDSDRPRVFYERDLAENCCAEGNVYENDDGEEVAVDKGEEGHHFIVEVEASDYIDRLTEELTESRNLTSVLLRNISVIAKFYGSVHIYEEVERSCRHLCIGWKSKELVEDHICREAKAISDRKKGG